MLKAALTSVGHKNPVVRTPVTCNFYDVQQRWLVICVGYHALIYTGRGRNISVNGTERQPHSRSQPFANHSPLQEDSIPEWFVIKGNDFKRKLIYGFRTGTLISQPGYFLKNPSAQPPFVSGISLHINPPSNQNVTVPSDSHFLSLNC